MPWVLRLITAQYYYYYYYLHTSPSAHTRSRQDTQHQARESDQPAAQQAMRQSKRTKSWAACLSIWVSFINPAIKLLTSLMRNYRLWNLQTVVLHSHNWSIQNSIGVKVIMAHNHDLSLPNWWIRVSFHCLAVISVSHVMRRNSHDMRN